MAPAIPAALPSQVHPLVVPQLVRACVSVRVCASKLPAPALAAACGALVSWWRVPLLSRSGPDGAPHEQLSTHGAGHSRGPTKPSAPFGGPSARACVRECACVRFQATSARARCRLRRPCQLVARAPAVTLRPRRGTTRAAEHAWRRPFPRPYQAECTLWWSLSWRGVREGQSSATTTGLAKAVIVTPTEAGIEKRTFWLRRDLNPRPFGLEPYSSALDRSATEPMLLE